MNDSIKKNDEDIQKHQELFEKSKFHQLLENTEGTLIMGIQNHIQKPIFNEIDKKVRFMSSETMEKCVQ